MSSRLSILALVSLLSIPACSTKLENFVCESEIDCGSNINTRCEPQGYCSVADERCPSGFRFSSASGVLSDSCTGAPDSDASIAPSDGRVDDTSDAGDIDAGQSDAGRDDAGSQPSGTIIGIAAAESHSCVLLAKGSTLCWGSNSRGQLNGVPGNIGSPLERLPENLENPIGIAAGNDATCIFGQEGVECFGDDGTSQLGNGFLGLVNTALVSIGKTSDASVCALSSPGGLACWGGNGDGQASGSGVASEPTPLPFIVFDNDIEYVASGARHVCVLRNDDIKCWGDNHFSQMADEADTINHSITDITVTFTPITIASGRHHSCTIDVTGRVYCWGNNVFGQAAPNRLEMFVDVATPLNNGVFAMELALGSGHSCLLSSDEKVYCWGDNTESQLGVPIGSPILTAVSSLDHVVRISAGQDHTCALVHDSPTKPNGVYCWGRNTRSQVSDSTDNTISVPVLSYLEDL